MPPRHHSRRHDALEHVVLRHRVHRLMAVSYTHLDVYKRQLLLGQVIVHVHHQPAAALGLPVCGVHVVPVGIADGVDVYKRQRLLKGSKRGSKNRMHAQGIHRKIRCAYIL